MRKSLASVALMATAAMLPGTFSAAAKPLLQPGTAKPVFVVGPRHNIPAYHTPSSNLPQWNGSFTDLKGNNVNFTQIGGNPSTTNTTSTITVLIIPIKMIYGSGNGNMTFDPNKTIVFRNRSVTKNFAKSPLFGTPGKLIDYNQGGTDLGNTQYIDAFQRGTWWGNDVSVNTSYHTIYQTKIEPEQSITVTPSQGKVEPNPVSGNTGTIGTMDINAFDSALQTFMRNISDVNPGVLPLFITYDIYLTSGGGCCIGGYHGANGGQPGGQTYSYATYEDKGNFSQDASAFSHELGEWEDDPFTDNFVHCNDNSLMEVGDPLERMANYGAFPYKLHGFKYNLQSLVFMPYFGAPRTDSVNQWLAFQNDESNVCPGQ
ncbi:MAG TPA: hypothetical protein VGI20_02890 [Rhizomicrobium sp.]|jgi:hypothetical protein